MGNTNIDNELKRDRRVIERFSISCAKYQNLKGFIDNACLELINNIKKNKT